MAPILRNFCKCISELETVFLNNLLQRFLPGLSPALASLPAPHYPQHQHSLKELLEESILWAVPKKRRSVQKVRSRRFGFPKYVWKPLVMRKDLVVCSQCGSHHEYGRLCGTCYKKIMDETLEMQKKIEDEFKNSPIEEEVHVVYEGEKENNPEFWKGKRIVEMAKPKPRFFSENLLQPSTQGESDSKEIVEVHHHLEYK